MTQCGATQQNGHGTRAHNCIGDPNHPGPHWCPLGHIWDTDENKEDQ